MQIGIRMKRKLVQPKQTMSLSPSALERVTGGDWVIDLIDKAGSTITESDTPFSDLLDALGRDK